MQPFTLQSQKILFIIEPDGLCLGASWHYATHFPTNLLAQRKWIVIVWCRSDRFSDFTQNQKFKGSSTNPTTKKEKWTQSSGSLTPPPAAISSLLLQFYSLLLFPDSLEEGNVVKCLSVAHTWLDYTLPDCMSLLNIWLNYFCMNCTNMIGSLSISDDVSLYLPENDLPQLFIYLPMPLLPLDFYFRDRLYGFTAKGIRRPMFVKHEDGLGFVSLRPLWLALIHLHAERVYASHSSSEGLEH